MVSDRARVTQGDSALRTWVIPDGEPGREVPMSSKVTGFVTGSVILPIALAGVCLLPGCSDSTHETGTVVTRTKEDAIAQQKSIEGMKGMMKSFPKAR